MKEERLLRAMTEIDAQLIQAHDPTQAEKLATPRKRRVLRIVLIAAAAAALLVTAALALSPTFRDIILSSLGFRAPYATDVLGSCEDQGITIEAQSALTDGCVTRLYFTVQDPSGVFFQEDTDNDLTVDLLLGDEPLWGSGGRSLERLSYDEETQTGLYVCSRNVGFTYGEEDDPIQPGTQPTQAKITMSYYVPGYRRFRGRFNGPMPFGEADLPINALESTMENGVVVLLPGQNPQPIDEDSPEIYISSTGFASDGCYHIRFHAEPGLVQVYDPDPNGELLWVRYDLFDRDVPNQQPETLAAVGTPVADGWDYCLPELTRETYDLLGTIAADSRYSVSGGYVWGSWELTVPISPVEECRIAKPEETLILSRTKDSPPPSGRNDEAQVDGVSVSPLSVVADFVTPADHEYPCSINGEETACCVTLSDGTTVEAIYYSDSWDYRKGWIMWEFPERIDPSQVVSVALNGNEITFPAE